MHGFRSGRRIDTRHDGRCHDERNKAEHPSERYHRGFRVISLRGQSQRCGAFGNQKQRRRKRYDASAYRKQNDVFTYARDIVFKQRKHFRRFSRFIGFDAGGDDEHRTDTEEERHAVRVERDLYSVDRKFSVERGNVFDEHRQYEDDGCRFDAFLVSDGDCGKHAKRNDDQISDAA